MKSAAPGPARKLGPSRVKVRTTVLLDTRLVRDAKAACGASTNSEAIERGLRELVRQAALARLADVVLKPDPSFRAAGRRRQG